ncbi:hypothetical protein [Gilliamella sp. ESL0250]|uniref:hypothetical protein n=1 Tax=Gilliamella sp. ESL0250 TaxID=2705036 RepID=UPI0015801471|nr:hypothetical protein [Gilliamella sp. ESL0250]NUF50439.1 hypothetical protein [Gilliamella sp. ESL0250]
MTNQVIHGSAPYLTLDGGITKTESLEELLSITLSNNKSYIPQGINNGLYPSGIIDFSSEINPIELPNKADTFESVQTIVPVANYPRINLAELVGEPYNYGKDDDGDGRVNATGSLTIKWQNKKGEDITDEVKAHPNKLLNICNAPYKLTLTATDAELWTPYGIPKGSHFSGSSHSYYIKPKIDIPLVCYAQPNLNNGTGVYAGPKEQWSENDGFKLQSLSDASKNFPTTGANNLYFKLILAGMTARQMIAINGSIVRPVSGMGITLSLTAENNALDENVVRVTLKGPTKDSMNKMFKPARFELYRDMAKNLIYQFKIDRWFIVKSGDTGQHYDNAVSFCKNLSSPQTYFVPAAQDYTNANGYDWNLGVPGQGNTYQRRISYWNNSQWVGGLFSEWGIIYDYRDAGWDSGDYWVTDVSQEGRRYNVFARLGDVDIHFWNNSSDRVACVAW